MAGDPLRTAAKGKDGRGPAPGQGVLLTWVVTPAGACRRRAPFLLALAVLCYLLFLGFGWPGLLLAMPLSLVAAAASLLPTRYALTREGVAVENPLQRGFWAWSDFSAYRETPDGVELLFDRRSLRHGWQSGVLVQAPHGTAEVVAVVSRFLPRAGGAGGGKGGAGQAPPGGGGSLRVRPLPAPDLAHQAGRNGRVPVGQRLKAVAAPARRA